LTALLHHEFRTKKVIKTLQSFKFDITAVMSFVHSNYLSIQSNSTFVYFLLITFCIPRSILLGSKGFDVPKLSEKLDQLDTTKTFEPLEPVRETDIQVSNV
jgi:hypothetical protein